MKQAKTFSQLKGECSAIAFSCPKRSNITESSSLEWIHKLEDVMNNAQHLLQSIIQQITTDNLDALSVHGLSESVGLSRWQVQRTFLAHTGMSLSEHIRNFRLSKAAESLVQTEEGVLDIAIATGFGSQAAFTRAFKSKFGLTPGQYRKRGLIDDISFQLLIPNNKTWSKAMNIKIETKPAMTLVGQMAYFNGHGMENANNFEVLPKLWEHFNSELCATENNVSRCFGYIYESDDSTKGQLRYLASYDKTEGPIELSNTIIENVPEQQYAVVPHHGLLQNIGETLDAFYGQWLPESDYKMAGNTNIEVYDGRFKPTEDSSYFETWVPVTRK
jgi:AraC family transcriptional regulator